MTNAPTTFTFSGTLLSSLGSAVTGRVVNPEGHQRQRNKNGATEKSAFLSWGVRCCMDKEGPGRQTPCDGIWDPRQR